MIGAPPPNANVLFKFRLGELRRVLETGSRNAGDYQAALDTPFVQSPLPPPLPMSNRNEAKERIDGLIAIFNHLTPGFDSIKAQIIDLYADSLISNYKSNEGKDPAEKEQLAIPKRNALKDTVLNKLLFDLVSANQTDVLSDIVKKIGTYQNGAGNFAAVEDYLKKEKIKIEKLVAEARYKRDPLVLEEYHKLERKKERFIELHHFLAEKDLTENELADKCPREYAELKAIEKEQNIRIKAVRDAEKKAEPIQEYVSVERRKRDATLAELQADKDKLLASAQILDRKLQDAEGDESLEGAFRAQLKVTQEKIRVIDAKREALTVVAQHEAEKKDELYLLEKMTSLWQTSAKAYHQGKKKLSSADDGGASQALNFFAQGGSARDLLERAKQRPKKKQVVASSSQPVVVDEHENPAQEEWLKLFLKEYGQDYPEGADLLKERISNFHTELASIYQAAQEEQASIRMIAANNREKAVSLNKDLEVSAEKYSQFVTDCVEEHSHIARLDLRGLIAAAGAKKFLGTTNIGSRATPFINSDKYLDMSLQVLNQDILLKKMMVDALKVSIEPVKGIPAQKQANKRYALYGYTKDGVLKIQFIKDAQEEDARAQVGKLNANKDSLAGLIIKVADYPVMFVVSDNTDVSRFVREKDGMPEIAGFRIVSESDAKRYISGDWDKDGKLAEDKKDKSAQTVYYPYLDLLTDTQLDRLANFIGIDFAIYFDANNSDKIAELKEVLQSKLSRSNITMADILYVALGYRVRDNDFALALESRFKPEGYFFDADNIKGDMFFADTVTIGHKTDSMLKLENVDINKLANNTQILADLNYKEKDDRDFIRRVEALEGKIEPIKEKLEEYEVALEGLPGRMREYREALDEIYSRIPGKDPQLSLREYLMSTTPDVFTSEEGRLKLVEEFSTVAMRNFDMIQLEEDANKFLGEIEKEINSTKTARDLARQQAALDVERQERYTELRREIKIDLYNDEDYLENEKSTARLDAMVEAEYLKRYGNNAAPVQQVAQRAERAQGQLQEVQRDIQLANRLGNDEELVRLRNIQRDLTREVEELRRQVATAALLQQQRLEVAQKSPEQVYQETHDVDAMLRQAALQHQEKVDVLAFSNFVKKVEAGKGGLTIAKVKEAQEKAKAYNSSAEERRNKYGW